MYLFVYMNTYMSVGFFFLFLKHAIEFRRSFHPRLSEDVPEMILIIGYSCFMLLTRGYDFSLRFLNA